VNARTLSDDLRASAARSADRTAVVYGDRRLTYAELDRAVDGFAAGLRQLGVRRGDRVAVVLANGVETAIAIYGALRAGAAFTPLNATAKEEKLAYLLEHSGAVAAVCDARNAHLVQNAAIRAPGLRHVVGVGGRIGDTPSLEELCETQPDDVGPAHPYPETLAVDLSAIIYTSGSTGLPKGVTFLHRNMAFVADSIIEYLGLRGDDRILCVLPLSHTYGLYHLIMAMRIGATLVLERGVTFPGKVVQALIDERITVLPGVPTVWQVLINLEGLAERDLSHLRLLTNAGAALSVARVAAVRKVFNNAVLFSMYGQTECKRVCYLPPEQLDIRPGSVGVAIPGTEVWIEDEHGERVAPGEVGELIIRGDHVMQGYWKDADATARKLKPGHWPGDRVLRSGDLFRQDDEGYLYFVGRSDDIIKSRGEKVAPKEVEEVLYLYEGVREAAVVGVEDDLLGQAIVAHVSAEDGVELDPRLLRRHCAERLEDFMVPGKVVIHDDLPKNDNGKLDKLALAAMRDLQVAAR
jgi:long-chain acyl-CoA synthetase